MSLRGAFTRLFAVVALLALPVAAASAQESYGPRDEEPKGGWSGEVSASATYAKRSRDLISDYDRSGAGLETVIGYTLPAGRTASFRLEGNVSADKYTTSYGARAELTQNLAENVTLRITGSGTRHAVVLESLDADQASAQAAVAVKSGEERIEIYGRHRWRRYHDAAAGTGKGWQLGARWRHRFGSYHWFNVHTAWDRIDDNGGRHGYRRTSVSLDYSHPVAKRLRLLAGTDYRVWTYDGRTIGDVSGAPRRHDRLVRPELGLSWGKTSGSYVRGTAGYDFYRSNDQRFSGNGPRTKLEIGFRF